MLGNRRLVLDSMCEIADIMKHRADEIFWDFSTVNLLPGSIYVIGRQHLLDNLSLVREAAESDQYIMIFNNSAEGSWTLEMQLKQLHIDDLVRQGKLLLIGGAEMSTEYACVTHEYFLSIVLDYEENIQAQQSTDKIFSKLSKPYKFLFLNGRARPHRKYLYERLRRTGALDQALWTMLDSAPCVWRTFEFREHGENVMAMPSPVTKLPDCYEVPRYRQPTVDPVMPIMRNIKSELFRQEWGEIYIEPAPYIDTYFSLVTETVCAESNLSFRTEKIAKPLAMGHPFVVAANPGFYRDLHKIGFKTFAHVIDESFDQIQNAQDRVNRIVDITTDLCQQDLVSFLEECYNVCKYNQQHLAELSIAERQQFPNRFLQFINQYANQ